MTPADASAPATDEGTPTESALEQPAGFSSRGRARRRARFLRRARELAYRDLGGLVFNLHRFGQRNDPLVLAKLSTLSHIDSELRAIETALRERRPLTVLREAGITACPRCAAIHGSEDRFCPNCGFAIARHADLPIAGAPAAPPPAQAAPQSTAPAPVTAPAAPTGTAVEPPSQPNPAEPASQPVAAEPVSRAVAAEPAAAEPASQPVAAEPAPADGHTAVGASLGRSPSPPRAQDPEQEQQAGETTEILRPGAGGS
jgi:hypothetical protein